MDYKKYIKDIPDFPTPGILFRDITPLLSDNEASIAAFDEIAAWAKEQGAELVVGPEARGFLIGCPVAYALKVGFSPVRKPGKLPRETVSASYDLEYGSNELHMHKDAVKPGQKVVIIDDLLATGGTVEAAIKLIEQLGGEVVGCAFLVELAALEGRKKLEGYNVFSLITY